MMEKSSELELLQEVGPLEDEAQETDFCAPTSNLQWFPPNKWALPHDKSKILFDCLTVVTLTCSNTIRGSFRG